MDLALTDEEARLLRQVLTNHIGDLRSEIVHTERYALRQELKHDEALLREIVARLAVDEVDVVAAT